MTKALSEWIYEPSPETMPIPGLELVRVQTPEQHHGINLQWAVLKNTSGCCFVVFRGSETMLDWTENSNLSLRRIDVPAWRGVLLVHSGFWSTAEAGSETETFLLLDILLPAESLLQQHTELLAHLLTLDSVTETRRIIHYSSPSSTR
ncbi:unnamed protein product [Symbiodinium sp. CCMP2456]|nr:unnamed protein product [Symbiodinium sp. CCMP2456]